MKQILLFVKTYILLVIIFAVQKPVFLLLENSSAAQPSTSLLADTAATIWHGLPLDLAIAAYLTVIPGLLLLFSVYMKHSIIRPLFNGWMAIAALVASTCTILNLALYPYWGFPLDSTPLFYFFTSPADALASTSIWVSLLALVADLTVAAVIWLLLRIRPPRSRDRYVRHKVERHRWTTAVSLLLLTVLLFLPIRGGVTVSTNNTGRVYYSQNIFLNHAAVNPVFSLIESILYTEDFSKQYRFMDDAEATKTLCQMTSTTDANTYPLVDDRTFQKGKPDILIIIMEGFASDLMQSLGGNHPDVAVRLDSIANTGVLFTRFYSNTFRTDRALVSILSGYPAQPTMSIMRYTDKAAKLPSLARTLTENRGYATSYFYGGDINFVNQRAYLVSQGFQQIVSDADFPVQDKLSKWGVPDHIVADRVLADIQAKHGQPTLRVFQTSSSHEPFDVPYSRLKDKRLNAFAYTDSVVGRLVSAYSRLPQWKNTLVVIVPDHVGGYKEHLNNQDRSRYQIPLILTGGVVKKPLKVGIIGSQIDIPATLLGQLGIGHKDFTFSKNMMSDQTPKFAFFTVPDAFGVVSEENSLIYDNKAAETVYDKGPKPGYNKKRGQAFLQKLYDDINEK